MAFVVVLPHSGCQLHVGQGLHGKPPFHAVFLLAFLGAILHTGHGVSVAQCSDFRGSLLYGLIEGGVLSRVKDWLFPCRAATSDTFAPAFLVHSHWSGSPQTRQAVVAALHHILEQVLE